MPTLPPVSHDYDSLCMRGYDGAVALMIAMGTGGCYHFSFEQRPPASPTQTAQSPADEVTYRVRAATYVNGFVGTGRVESYRYCPHPIRTELRVTGIDVLLGFFTLLIYTPHTLYVTCPRSETRPENAEDAI
jgi:hypothetical protein